MCSPRYVSPWKGNIHPRQIRGHSSAQSSPEVRSVSFILPLVSFTLDSRPLKTSKWALWCREIRRIIAVLTWEVKATSNLRERVGKWSLCGLFPVSQFCHRQGSSSDRSGCGHQRSPNWCPEEGSCLLSGAADLRGGIKNSTAILFLCRLQSAAPSELKKTRATAKSKHRESNPIQFCVNPWAHTWHSHAWVWFWGFESWADGQTFTQVPWLTQSGTHEGPIQRAQHRLWTLNEPWTNHGCRNGNWNLESETKGFCWD